MRLLLGVTFLVAACAPSGATLARIPGLTPAAPDPAVHPEMAAVPTPTEAAAEAEPEREREPEPIVLISDPASLASLRLDFGPTAFGQDASSTLELRKSRSYRDLARVLAIFGARKWWLRHPSTTFELAAVVNRLDRMDVMSGTCGETRLVYRLVHHTDEGTTQALPLALNVLFVQQASENGCAAVAKSWRVEGVEALAEGDGPLSASKLSVANQHAIESNLRHDLHGAAVNELRIHERVADARWDEGMWREGLLEFSPQPMYKGRGWPRVAALLTEPSMREAIYQGTPTTKDRSIRYPDWDSTGSDAWGPIEPLLPDDADYAPFASKDAFLERGRSLTCGGCHETRAVDGFHASREPSAHLLDEVPWRTAYVQAVAEGREPNRRRLSVYGEE